MSNQVEAIGASETTTRTINLVDFHPRDTENFLLGWDFKEIVQNIYFQDDPRPELNHQGWQFTRNFDGKDWWFIVNQRLRTITFNIPSGNLDSIELEDISSVVIDPKYGEVKFVTGNGRGYFFAAEEGSYVGFKSPDHKLTIRKRINSNYVLRRSGLKF